MRGSKLNLAVRTYEPGSVMKVVTASGAFEKNLVQLDTSFTVPGRIKVADKWVGDAEAHGTENLTVQQIIAQSSNVGTIKIAQLLGQQRILDYLDKFGLGKTTDLGLDKEQAGAVPPQVVRLRHRVDPDRSVDHRHAAADLVDVQHDRQRRDLRAAEA